MLRLPERLRLYLAETFMTLLLSGSLALPGLRALMLPQEQGYLLMLLSCLALSLPLLKRLNSRPRMAARLALAGLFIWWALANGLPAALESLFSALIALKPLGPVMTLYADVLLLCGAIALSLFARLLMQGEPAFSAPMLLSSALMLWFSGARGSVADFFPAILSMPLLFSYAGIEGQRPRLKGEPEKSGGFLKALPVVLLIALLSLALTPPYRSTQPALEQQADRLRQYINDNFFFTQSRENFSLASEGYQPMGASGLGGKPQISNASVMSVDTGRKVYLRGTMLDLYNGRQWFDSLSSERYGYTAARFSGIRDSLLDAKLPQPDLRLDAQTVSVSILSDLPSTLFAPQRVRSLNLSDGMVPYLNASSELFITRNLAPGDRYAMDYEPYIAGTAETDALARSLSGAQDSRFALLPDAYLQLPRHLQPGGLIDRLARDIAGDEREPYRQAMLIRDYLRDNYRYTLDVDIAPEDFDFAQHFLFDTKEGYCTYFATAMTLLCRSLSLPSRYIEGFVALPGENGEPNIVTGQQAHAWTEVYIPALGWVTFDATGTTGELPPGESDEPSPPPDEPEPENSPEPTPENQEAPGEEPQDSPSPPPPENTPAPSPSAAPEKEEGENLDNPTPPRSFSWLMWLLLIMVMSLLIWRIRASEPKRRAAKAGSPAGQLLIYWQSYVMVMKAAGSPMLASETLRDYASRLAPDDRSLHSLADSVSAVLYGRHGADAARVHAAQTRYTSAWQALPAHRRVLVIARRTKDDLLGHAGRLLMKLKAKISPSAWR